jgi:hypothetical protein
MTDIGIIFQEEIINEEIKKHLIYLESPYPVLIAASLRELDKLKYPLNHKIFELIKNNDLRVRKEAYRYIRKRIEELPEEKRKEILFTQFNDFSHHLRKDAIRQIIEKEYLNEDIKNKAINDANGSVRYEFLKTYIEYNPSQKKVIASIFKDDPYSYIQKFLEGLKDIKSILLSSATTKIKKDALRAFNEENTVEDLYKLYDLFFKFNKTTKNIMLSFLPILGKERIKNIAIKIIKNENDSEIIDRTVRILIKYDINALDNSLDDYLESKDSKLIKLFFFVQKKKDNMNYVENARSFLNTNDDEIINSAGEYLLYYSDYKLEKHVKKLLESKNSKRISLAIKIIKKLNLEIYLPELAIISNNKIYPSTLRKNALTVIKKFKAITYIFAVEDILKDSSEKASLRIEALKVIEKISNQRLKEIYEEKEEKEEFVNA